MPQITDNELIEQLKYEEYWWDAHGIPETNVNPHEPKCDCSPELLRLEDIKRFNGATARVFRCINCGKEHDIWDESQMN